MLKLRRGTVSSVALHGERVARLRVVFDGGEERAAVSFPGLTGPVEAGDEVVVNVEAQDLGLGSGGFDVVHVNLSRLPAPLDRGEAHVMKLNYTSLQHAVRPVEEGLEGFDRPLEMPVCVLALHGQLATAAFALNGVVPVLRCGFVQIAGGALPGALSDTVADLLDRGLLCDHVTVAPCFGGGHDAITPEGALHAAAVRLGWDCAIVGPGPGMLGSASALGNGGLAALAGAHAALSLGAPVVVAPRVSSCDPRPRHRGLSHHTRTVLALLLAPVRVAVPVQLSPEAAGELAAAIAGGRHEAVRVDVGALFAAYLAAGLPDTTMGRTVGEDPDFFAAGLAGGAALAASLPQRDH